MELSKRKAVIVVAIESPYGTDATPTGANAIGVSDLKISPAKGTKKKRAIAFPDHGTQSHKMLQQHQEVSFTLELNGAGVAGDVPECGVLLRACMMSQTITPGVDVSYQMVSAAYESVSIYVNMDGILHKLIGFRGTPALEWNGGDYPSCKISGLALGVAPVDLAPPVPVYTNVEPVEVNSANTAFSLGGFPAVLHKLILEPQVRTKYRDLPNQSAEIKIVGRDCKGSVVLDAVKNEDHNFWEDWSASTKLPLALTHGTVSGHIVEVSAPQVQLDTVDYGDVDDVLTFNSPIALTRNTGDDEFILTFK